MRADRRADRRAQLAAAGTAIFVVAFAVGAWVVVPLAAAQGLAAWAEAAPGRSASARHVTVNPFTLTVSLRDVAFSAPGASLSADRAELDFGIAALFSRAVALDELMLDGARLQLGGAASASRDEADSAPGFVPSPPFSVARLAVSRGRIEWHAERGVPIVLDAVTLQALDVDSASDAPARFEIDARNALGGVLRITGEAVLGTPAARGRVVFENIDAAPIATRLLESPSVAGTSGGAADFEWHGDSGALHLRDATLRVARVELEWADGGTLSAASLEAAGVAELRASTPLSGSASFETLALSGPRTTLVLDSRGDTEDRQVLDRVLGMLSVPRVEAAGGTPNVDPSLRPLAVEADRIELADGVLEIVDAGLDGSRPFVTAFDVDGTVERLGPGVTASVSARIGDGGTATLDMRAGLGAADARDVTLELQGVPATVFAQHAERLAGYVLDGGTVHATIEYRTDGNGIDGDGIDGNARVGGRGLGIEPAAGPVQSSTIENIPSIEDIELALALLEDAHGAAETSFDFPAPQDADGEARLGGMLAAGVVAELRAAAASPFDALGAAAGVEGAALSAVSFPPGGAEPSEPATLDALAEALNARPRIGLRVPGVADGMLDRDALAVQQIELHVTLATAGQTLVARPQPVDFASPRHQDVLDEFARERLGDEQRETIASYFARTPDGRIVESDRAAYYRALFDALVENEAIPENGIARLGRYRARAIADGLAARGIMETRIEIAPAVVRSDGESAGEQRRTAASGDAAAGVSPPQVQLPLEVLVMAPSLGARAEPERDVGSPPATR